MAKKHKRLTDLMPKAGRQLVAYTGKEAVAKIGAEIVKDVVASILCGENVRDLTEKLTKRRITLINGALLAFFIRGCNDIDDFSNNYAAYVGEELKSKITQDEKIILLWMLGLTGKGVQNVLRSKESNLGKYIDSYEENTKSLIKECENSYGPISGSLTNSDYEAKFDWKLATRLLQTIGTSTLAIRGAEKSMYGKLFEKLVLGACLTLLGFKLIDPDKNDSCNKVFWLSSRGSKRESDATALYEAGKGIRFDIGFIGPGNTEISLDKVSRFEREHEHGRQKHFMATFVIVDRIGARSRIGDLAKKINGSIIQMSMAFWPQVLARQLGPILGFKHPLQTMSAMEVEKFLRHEVAKINIEDFVK